MLFFRRQQQSEFERLPKRFLIDKLLRMFVRSESQNTKLILERKMIEQFKADMAKEKADWLSQCLADSEFGGQAWEASQAVIDRGCKQVATQAAVELLQRYNLHTHPEIVRMFYRAGKLAELLGGDGVRGEAPGG